MLIAVRRLGAADDLTGVVYGVRDAIPAAQRAQVDHADARRPQERSRLAARSSCQTAAADHLPRVVEAECLTPRAAQRAEVDHGAFPSPS